MTIEPPDDFGPIDEAIARLRSFDWLVFTSGNGVRHFLDRLESRGLDLRALGHLKLAAIGPATAEALGRYHLKADLVPDSFRSEALAEALAPHVAGRRVLLARADRGRTVLKDELRRVAQVEQVAVYRNLDAGAIDPVVLGRIAEGSVDWITLTSSAITERLHALLPDEARRRIGRSIRLASLSPVTSATAERLGWPIAAEARTYTWDGLVAAIVERVALDREGAPDASDGPPFVPPDSGRFDAMLGIRIRPARRRPIAGAAGSRADHPGGWTRLSSRAVSSPCQRTKAPPMMNRMSRTRLIRPRSPSVASSRKINVTRPAMTIAA